VKLGTCEKLKQITFWRNNKLGFVNLYRSVSERECHCATTVRHN